MSATISLRILNASTVGTASGNVLAEIKIDAQTLQNYESYNFHQNYMQPADEWTFHVGAERINETMRNVLRNNAVVALNCEYDDGDIQFSRVISTGYIDQVKLHNYREGRGGSYYEIRGRSFLAQAIDDGIDPWSNTFEFQEGQSFGHVLSTIFNQYGLDTFYTTDAPARDIVTGQKRFSTESSYVIEGVGGQTTVIQDSNAPFDLETLKIKKLKPEPHETAYSFAETHAKRFHLHIWGYPAGDGIVVGQPDYTQDPTFHFINRYDGNGNNIHESWIELDSVNMPALIIAKGWSGGGDFANTTIKCAKVNEYLGYKSGAYAANPTGSKATFNANYIKTSVLARINRFKNLKIMDPVENLLLYQDSQRFFNPEDVRTTVAYWEDKTSRTQDSLEASVQRRMSDFMRNAVRLHVKVDGHCDTSGNIYRYNTVATVQDEKLNINAPFFVEDVVFRKSGGEGTVTEMKLIPLNTLFFGGVAGNSAGKTALRIR